MLTLGTLWADAQRRLAAAGVPEPRLDAGVLLAHAAGQNRSWLLAHTDDLADDALVDKFEPMLARREGREPLAYILGGREFYGLWFIVSPAVLIPRQETELLVDLALERAGQGPCTMADVGAGSGCIAIACARNAPNLRVRAMDLSFDALDIARLNAHRLLDHPHQVEIAYNDLLEETPPSSYNLVVSNLPYIAESEPLEPEVADHEPRLALFAPENGLALFRRLAPEAFEALKPGGSLLLEVGKGQSKYVEAMLNEIGFSEVRSWNDLAGIPRVVGGVKPATRGQIED